MKRNDPLHRRLAQLEATVGGYKPRIIVHQIVEPVLDELGVMGGRACRDHAEIRGLDESKRELAREESETEDAFEERVMASLAKEERWVMFS